jgi:hypothetical protein
MGRRSCELYHCRASNFRDSKPGGSQLASVEVGIPTLPALDMLGFRPGWQLSWERTKETGWQGLSLSRCRSHKRHTAVEARLSPRCFMAIFDLKLLQQVMDMIFHCVGSDAEVVRNFLVAKAAGY